MEATQEIPVTEMTGPDQIFEASSYVTAEIDGAVKLRLDENTEAITPISLPSMLVEAAEKSPNHVALGVKRDGEWKKWTYSDYLKGYTITFKTCLNTVLKI